MAEGSLLALAGWRVVSIFRTDYELRGQVLNRGGAVEVLFDAGPRLFECGADGEELRVSDTSWLDPFDGPQDDVNLKYIEECGKWTKYDVSNQAPYEHFVGSTVGNLRTVALGSGKVVGVDIVTSAGQISLRVEFDELRVEFGPGREG